MIFKKIRAKKVKQKAAHVGDLIGYITDELRGGDDTMQRVGLVISRNFLFDDLPLQISEMATLASESVRSKNPVNHYVMSWREGELPTPQQIEESLDIFTEQTGLGGCQMIAAYHQNTANRHLHIAVNRVDPITHKVREIENGFDIKAGNRAIAKIEHKQGWKPADNAIFEVNSLGEIVRRGRKKKNTPPLPQGAADAEARSGQKSIARQAVERAGDVFEVATSWQELHRLLAIKGLRYERKGSGALVWLGDEALKASTVSRAASLSKMEKRLGAYIAPPEARENDYFRGATIPSELDAGEHWQRNEHGMRVLSECRLAGYGKRASADLLQGDARFDRSAIAEMQRASTPTRNRGMGSSASPSGTRGVSRGGSGGSHGGAALADADPVLVARYRREVADFAVQKAAAKATLAARQAAELARLKAQQKQDAAEMLKGSWVGKGAALNVLRRAIKESHAEPMAALKAEHKRQRQKLVIQWKAWADFAEWMRKRSSMIDVEIWRYRRTKVIFIVGSYQVPMMAVSVENYDSIHVGDCIHYRRKGDDEIAFTDKGSFITVHDWQDDQVLLDALMVASTKWGSFQLIGDDQFKARCVALAVKHDLSITNVELRPLIEAAKNLLPKPAAEIEAIDPEVAVIDSMAAHTPGPVLPFDILVEADQWKDFIKEFGEFGGDPVQREAKRDNAWEAVLGAGYSLANTAEIMALLTSESLQHRGRSEREHDDWMRNALATEEAERIANFGRDDGLDM